jgi:type IV secretion system protein VirB2
MSEVMTPGFGERVAIAAILISAVLAVAPDVALAQSGSGSFQPINTAMQSVLTFMTGTFATTCATIAVAAVGFLCFTSRIPWGWAFSVIVGIALVFGAAQIVQVLQSSAGTGG